MSALARLPARARRFGAPSLALAVLLSAACAAPPPSDPAPSVAAAATAPAPAPAPAARPAPGTLETLLLARHTEDLPTCAALNRHPDPALTLDRLSRESDRLVVRARALVLSGACYTASARAPLLAVAADDTAHPKLRAAALEGLARAAEPPDPATRATAERLRTSADPRIAAAASRLALR